MLTIARKAQNYGTFLRPATTSSMGICQQKCDEISYASEKTLVKLQDLKLLDEGYLINTVDSTKFLNLLTCIQLSWNNLYTAVSSV